jgi:hypothetical protein
LEGRGHSCFDKSACEPSDETGLGRANHAISTGYKTGYVMGRGSKLSLENTRKARLGESCRPCQLPGRKLWKTTVRMTLRDDYTVGIVHDGVRQNIDIRADFGV